MKLSKSLAKMLNSNQSLQHEKIAMNVSAVELKESSLVKNKVIWNL